MIFIQQMQSLKAKTTTVTIIMENPYVGLWDVKWNFNNSAYYRVVPWYSRQIERLKSMPIMGSSLEWTIPGLTFRLRGNEFCLNRLFME